MILIDADKIEINEECTFSGKGIKAFLDAIPTAYNVDKVVELLEKESQNIELIYPTDQGYDYEDAIGIDINKTKQIVKSGGIAEEKKAEWKEHFASRFGRVE